MNIFQVFLQTREGFFCPLNLRIKTDWWQYSSICQTYFQNKLPPQKFNTEINLEQDLSLTFDEYRNIEKLKNFLRSQLWLFFKACCVSLQFLAYVPPLSILRLKWTITALHLEKVIWYGSHMAPSPQMPPIYPVFRLDAACLFLQGTEEEFQSGWHR